MDLYSKAVLTVIACALVALVAQNGVRPAQAIDGQSCRDPRNPCYVTTSPDYPVQVFKRSY